MVIFLNTIILSHSTILHYMTTMLNFMTTNASIYDNNVSVYGNNAMLLRRNDWGDSRLRDRLENFTARHPEPSGKYPG